MRLDKKRIKAISKCPFLSQDANRCQVNWNHHREVGGGMGGALKILLSCSRTLKGDLRSIFNNTFPFS